MKVDIKKVRKFYETALGQNVHSVISKALKTALDSLPSNILCITSHGGYFYEKTLRSYFTTLLRHTPDDEPDDVYSMRWATTTRTADCVVMIHDIEFSRLPENDIAEAWRVLKDHGKLIIVFPNRGGPWSASDNTPFGFGTPQSLRQIRQLLETKNFYIKNTEGFLYYPPKKIRPSFIRDVAEYTKGFFGIYKPGIVMVQAVKSQDKGKVVPTLSNFAENVGRALQPKPTATTRTPRSELE